MPDNDACPVIVLDAPRFGDERGWFMETWHAQKWAARGVGAEFVQDNQSFSKARHTLRGLHFQAPPHAQAKLVRCVRGALLDVAVDLRGGSPTYGEWVGAMLDEDNGRQLFIPEGFAHGFVSLTGDCEIAYKVSDFYAPDCDGGIRWDDPDIGVDWGLPAGAEPVLSGKDRGLPLLADWQSPFEYDGRPLQPLGAEHKGSL
jgi:dTDP-4-dehydrorhamnose 3,5-epimerase